MSSIRSSRGGRPSSASGVVVAVATASSTVQPVCATRSAQAVEQRGGRAGEGAVGSRTVPSATTTSWSPSRVGPSGRPSAAVVSETDRNRSGPERAPRRTHEVRVEVVAVDDHAGDQVAAAESDTDRAGLAGQQRRHRVAEVGDAAGAGLDGGQHLGGRRPRCGRPTRRRRGRPGARSPPAHRAARGRSSPSRRRPRATSRRPGRATALAASARGARPCGSARSSAPRSAGRAARRPTQPGGRAGGQGGQRLRPGVRVAR